jgi:hypothetical protein
VAVIAQSPFYGRPRLLGPGVAWRFQGAVGGEARAKDAPWTPAHRLVVSDVLPPAELGLPVLPSGAADDGAADRLQGAAATPTQVAEALAHADLAELHVHAVTDRDLGNQAYLALSPEPGGRSTLTADDVRKLRLQNAPVVVLAACNSVASSRFLPSSSATRALPAAFLQAGARAVLAAGSPIPDREAGPFFAEVIAKAKAGAPLATALRDVRTAWLAHAPGAEWVLDVVLFD